MGSLNFLKHLSFACPVLKPSKPLNTSGRKVLICALSTFRETFKFSELDISDVKPSKKKPSIDVSTLKFGHHFSDHMFEVKWDRQKGWGIPRICQFHDLALHPAAKVLHYCQEAFEGLKAFRSIDNKILLFRPMLNLNRFTSSSLRLSLPSFDENEFLMCLKKLISIEKDWVPNAEMSSLYIRPNFIGTQGTLGVSSSNEALLYVITGPVGPYFSTGAREPISLLADAQHIRAWPGGIGDKKSGTNYGPTIFVQDQATKQGHQQVLWLFGKDHQITEVGTMNIFVFLLNENGEKELVTPPLNGIILPGVVRQTVLELAREWNEFKVSERIITMKEVLDAVSQNRLLEIFGTGTAGVVCPVGSITYMEKKTDVPFSDDLNGRIYNILHDIQHGKIPSKWVENVD